MITMSLKQNVTVTVTVAVLSYWGYLIRKEDERAGYFCIESVLCDHTLYHPKVVLWNGRDI